jgi:hypothetical protein
MRLALIVRLFDITKLFPLLPAIERIARMIVRRYINGRQMAIGDLGNFPDYLLPMSRNLLLSHGSIFIAMDVPDPAYIFNNHCYRIWRKRIAKIARKRDVELLLPENPSLISASSGLQGCRDLEQLRKQKWWKPFSDRNPALRKVGRIEEFDSCLSTNIWSEVKYYHSVGVHILFRHSGAEPMARYLLLADDLVMISPAWQARETPARAHASDNSEHIDLYREIYNQYRRGSEPYYPK